MNRAGVGQVAVDALQWDCRFQAPVRVGLRTLWTGPLFPIGSCRVLFSVAFGVQTEGVLKLVFEVDDAAGGVQGGAFVEQGPHPRCQA